MIGLFEGDGTSSWDLNVRQYVCSGVRVVGPGGSFKGWRGSTGADMLLSSSLRGASRIRIAHQS